MPQNKQNLKVRMAGNNFINCEKLITYEDKLILAAQQTDDGDLQIDLDIYDRRGKKVAVIRNSTVTEGNANTYQINHLADCSKIIEKTTGRILVQIEKKPRQLDWDISVNTHLPSGYLLEVTPDTINIGALKKIGETFQDCHAGIAIGSSSRGPGMGLAKPKF